MTMQDRQINKLVTEYLAIEAESAKEAGMLTYMARSMVMATLPHAKPKDYVFERTNGNFTLSMIGNPNFGLPYGSLPRLLIAWVTTEAKKKKSPIIHLGESFTSFLKIMKLSQNGGARGDATRLREQMLRLFSTHISCIYQNRKEGICKAEQFSFTSSFKLWWNPIKKEKSKFLSRSSITLAKDFFDEITYRPIPIDFRMLQALRRSPLQMDIYVWLTYRFFYLKKPTLVSWDLLRQQFGAGYSDKSQGLRDFKREFLKSLHVVKVMYQAAQVEAEPGGVLLKPSKTHVLALKK